MVGVFSQKTKVGNNVKIMEAQLLNQIYNPLNHCKK